MGSGAAAGLDGRSIKDTKDVCLVKYYMTNKNTIHDLRFQLFDMTEPGDGTHKKTSASRVKPFITKATTMGIFILLYATYI